MTTPIPSIPLFTSAVDGIFAKILASLQAKRLAAEAALPGSGKFFDQEIADVTAARAAVSPAALAQLLVTDMGSFIAGTAPIVHKGSDLAR